MLQLFQKKAARLNNKIFLIPHSLLLGQGDKLFDYIADCLQRFKIDNKLGENNSNSGEKFPLGKQIIFL